MNDNDILKNVLLLLKKIAPESEPEKLKPEESIKTVLDLDSFDYLQFIVAIDHKFGIETPEADYGKINTLKKLVNYLRERIQNRSITT
jgi:acyl carrier protein